MPRSKLREKRLHKLSHSSPMATREVSAKRKASQLATTHGAHLLKVLNKLPKLARQGVTFDGDADGASSNADKEEASTKSAKSGLEAKITQKPLFKRRDEIDLHFIRLLKKNGCKNCPFKERTAFYQKLLLAMAVEYPEIKDPVRVLSERLGVLQGNFKKRAVENQVLKEKGEPAMQGLTWRKEVEDMFEDNEAADESSVNVSKAVNDEESSLKRTRPHTKEELKEAMQILIEALKDPREAHVREEEISVRKQEAVAREAEAKVKLAQLELEEESMRLKRKQKIAKMKFNEQRKARESKMQELLYGLLEKQFL